VIPTPFSFYFLFFFILDNPFCLLPLPFPLLFFYLHDYNDYLWMQEHIVFFIVKMLSPPVPPKYSGTESYLINHAPLLNVLLVGISSVDSVQIFSLHGVVCSYLI